MIDEKNGEVRSDLTFKDERIIGEDGKPLTAEQLKSKLEEEENFFDDLLFKWFGDEYEPPNNKLDMVDQMIIEKEKEPTVIDVDTDELEDEE